MYHIFSLRANKREPWMKKFTIGPRIACFSIRDYLPSQVQQPRAWAETPKRPDEKAHASPTRALISLGKAQYW